MSITKTRKPTHPEQHIDQQKADEQYTSYRFSRSVFLGRPCIYVMSDQHCYTVTSHGDGLQCNCRQFRSRCAGTTRRCKHIVMACRWNREQREESARRLIDRAEVTCPSCGTEYRPDPEANPDGCPTCREREIEENRARREWEQVVETEREMDRLRSERARLWD